MCLHSIPYVFVWPKALPKASFSLVVLHGRISQDFQTRVFDAGVLGHGVCV